MIYFICNGLNNHKAVEISFERLKSVFVESNLSVSFNEIEAISSKNNSLLGIFSLFKTLRKGDLIVAPTFQVAIICYIISAFRRTKVIYWVQGDISEEVYLRTSSIIKKRIVGILDLFALYLSDIHVYVSMEMERVYQQRITKPALVIPCTSSLKYINCKKEVDSYCYIGGLSEWQKLDWICDYFQKRTLCNQNVKLYIATQDREKAKKIVRQFGIENNTEIVTLNGEEKISEFLSTKMYGFLFRDESPVNSVSSPIKLAEYLSCGVSVLISPSVKSYANLVEDSGCGRIIKHDVEPLTEFVVYPERNIQLFKDVFSTDASASRLEEFMQEFMRKN